MALKQNIGGSNGVQHDQQPLAPKRNTTGAQNSEYSPAPLERYRDAFRASPTTPEPYVVVSLDVMIADSTEAARELLLPEAWAMAESRETGVFGPLRSPAQTRARKFRPQQLRRMDEWMAGTVHGDAAKVAGDLARLVELTGADEIMASTSTYDRDDLARSDAAVAELLPG